MVPGWTPSYIPMRTRSVEGPLSLLSEPPLKSDPVRDRPLCIGTGKGGRRTRQGGSVWSSTSLPSFFLSSFFYDVKSTNCVMVKSRGFGVRPTRGSSPSSASSELCDPRQMSPPLSLEFLHLHHLLALDWAEAGDLQPIRVSQHTSAVGVLPQGRLSCKRSEEHWPALCPGAVRMPTMPSS